MIRSEHTLSDGTRSEFTRDKKTIVRQRQESAAIGGDCPAGREMGVIPMLSVAPHARPSTARVLFFGWQRYAILELDNEGRIVLLNRMVEQTRWDPSPRPGRPGRSADT